ncbi:S9 family peptidase [Mucilaginibacter robiniae]|uniref:S9 family peptidase n=1 Tax=Mucilaginibacter robiniae TaxID=2728022 RepID=A0A7L5E257_9SPHI|nr:S9 family peptidase [Mucilaginibacter robiniae]QJD96638.1 S9 family peptidase [Mucilaginibacter robiniae]
MKKAFLLLFHSFLIISAALAQQNSTIEVTDLTRIKQISGVALSHDGKKVAFTLTSIIPDQKNSKEYTYQNQVWLASTDNSFTPHALLDSTASQAAWSTDDQTIAVVSSIKGRSQIFLVPANGGQPVQLTHAQYGASSPQWSPNGKRILFSVNLSLNELLKDSVLNSQKQVPAWASEKPGYSQFPGLPTIVPNPNGNFAAIRSYLAQDEADHKVKVFNKLNFEGEATTEPDFRFTHYFIMNAEAGAKPRPLTNGFNSFSNAQFMPDGRSIIISAPDSTANPDRAVQAAIYSIPVAGGSRKLVLAQDNAMLSNAAISPSGQYLVYTSGKSMVIDIPEIKILDLQHPTQIITIPLDRSAANFTWSADSKYLYFTAQSNGGIPIYRVNVTNTKPEQLSSFEAGLSGLDVGKKLLVYVKTEVANPFELYVSDLSNKSPKRLTSFNYEWLKDKKLSYPEKKYYTNSKGLKVEYWVMKPTNFQTGKKYPIMLQIHGGPTAMWGPGESSMWHEYQFFCAHGYGVVYSNPRGSGGYGLDFLKANYQDWGTGPTEDVLAALDSTLAEGWGDPAKTVATGGSYAGYLTAWLASHTKRFAAISSQRGVYDLTTFFGEGNAWRLVPMYFGGYPWEPQIKPILTRESPFTYVNQITTPYLMLHGETDLRTGIVQGEMMYKALKVLNRPVEYVQHPGGTHELSRSGNVRQRIDQMLRIYEFFGRYIQE